MSYKLKLYDTITNPHSPQSTFLYTNVINAAYDSTQGTGANAFHKKIDDIFEEYNAKRVAYGHSISRSKLYYAEFENQIDAIRFKLTWS